MANPRTPRAPSSARVKTLVLLVDLLALGSIAALALVGGAARTLPMVSLCVLAALVGSRAVRISRLKMQVTASDLFVFCSLVALAPVVAPLVALASVAGAAIGRGRRATAIKTAFNLGAVPLSASAAAFVFHALGGRAGAPLTVALPLLVAAVTYAAVNMALVATAIQLDAGGGWFRSCRRSASWSVVSSVTSALVGAGLLLVLDAFGPVGLALGVIPSIPLQAYMREQRRRAERRAEPENDSGDDEAAPAREATA